MGTLLAESVPIVALAAVVAIGAHEGIEAFYDNMLTPDLSGTPATPPEDPDDFENIDHSSQLDVSGKRARVRLRTALKTPKGQQAHHTIPWELRNHTVVRQAARGGFNMNGKMNGISLGPTRHMGSHPQYTRIVERSLNRMGNKPMNDRQAALALRNYAIRANRIISRSSAKLR
ncbi:MAG: hypothetical protein COA86_18660 [Kangiella sp.]|nr:MAG: hypothetical protein COA86_18660 [Kangiella sp.]